MALPGFKPSQGIDGRDTDINILLLGETGVGKSTFINSFANYIQFGTLKEASKSKLVCLIPTSFTIPDENYDVWQVKFGDDTNEDQAVGNSSTQGARSYIFPMKGDSRRIRLIDTPGIGDSRGIDHDNVNFENILDYLSNFNYLHAICFLLKPNVSILTAYFKYCILHLLSRLEKSAVRNIVFVFTNSRSTLYKPAETLTVLRRIVDEIRNSPPHVSIPLDKANMFCMDNEAFRFLVGLQSGIAFDSAHLKTFSHSWKQSADTCAALLNYIAGEKSVRTIEPHSIKNTLSVNASRRAISCILKPMVDISDSIEDNLMLLESHEREIARDDLSIADFKKNLFVPVVLLEHKNLDHPATVCTSAKCTDITTVNGITKKHHKQRCHDPCLLTNVTPDIIGSLQLLKCSAMKGIRCGVCGCNFATHMHIFYETTPVSRNIVDTTIHAKITTAEEHKLQQKQLIKQLRKQRDEYLYEKVTIIRCMAKFVYFIKEHSISISNDSYERYLDHLIDRETRSGNSNSTFVKRHEAIKKQYLEEKHLIMSVGTTPNARVKLLSATTINNCIRSLYNLKHTGRMIMELHQKQEAMRSKEHEQCDEYQHAKAIKRDQKGRIVTVGKIGRVLNKLRIS